MTDVNTVNTAVRDAIGAYEVLAAYREGSPRCGVWKLRSAVGDCFLKLHREKRKWHPEVYAYRNWVASARPHVPELLTVIEDESCQGIVVSDVGGRPLRETPVSVETALHVYEQAGRVLRTLQDQETGQWFGVPQADGQPFGPKWDNVIDFIAADFDEWCAPALRDGCLDAHETSLADWARNHLHVFAGEPPVPINRDHMPKNWMVEGNRFAGCIDFECMQWGVRVDSIAVLWHRYFPALPGAEEAFFNGYGRSLDPDQIRWVRIKMGLAGIAFGRSQSDLETERFSRESLRRLKA